MGLGCVQNTFEFDNIRIVGVKFELEIIAHSIPISAFA